MKVEIEQILDNIRNDNCCDYFQDWVREIEEYIKELDNKIYSIKEFINEF